ncbi:MAG: hypothetical protein RSB05_07885, partial [Clostridiales bacterium]
MEIIIPVEIMKTNPMESNMESIMVTASEKLFNTFMVCVAFISPKAVIENENTALNIKSFKMHGRNIKIPAIMPKLPTVAFIISIQPRR